MSVIFHDRENQEAAILGRTRNKSDASLALLNNIKEYIRSIS